MVNQMNEELWTVRDEREFQRMALLRARMDNLRRDRLTAVINRTNLRSASTVPEVLDELIKHADQLVATLEPFVHRPGAE